MDRREFIRGSAVTLIGVSCVADAQQQPKVARIGYLTSGPLATSGFDVLRQGLRERGYVEGQNLIIEYRAADGKLDRLPALANELARLQLDVIVAPATPTARALQQATTTTPIVAPAMGDPVRDGLVASLARPGGNITGSTFLGPELVPKRLELLKEALPKASRIAVLWHPGAYGERTMKEMLQQTEDSTRKLGMQFQLVEVRGPEDFDRAFSMMAHEHADAVFVFPSPMLFAERERLVALADKHRLPTIFNARQSVELGGLIGYGASIPDLNRRAIAYVDKILKGAKPGDLPVEQPTQFELLINLKTARKLGLTIPQSLLLRADEVIQ